MTLDPEREPRSHVTDDDLLDLIHGASSTERREEVVSHLLGCEACDGRFRSIVRDHERGRALAADALTSAPAAAPGAHAGAARRAWWPRFAGWRAPLVAALLLTIGGTWMLARHGPGTDPAARARPEWLPQVTRWGNLRQAAESSADSIVLVAIEAYERRDLRRAESLLRTPGAVGSYEFLRRLYLANTLEALGRSEEALPELVGMSWMLPEPWRGEWDWTSMVACARSGRMARADSLLDVLRRRDDAIGARARALGNDARGGR